MPGCRTSPHKVNTIVPGDSSVPNERNHSAPRRRMCGTFASVSTLLTTVGLGESGDRKSPSIHGGTMRGSGSLPSMTSSSAFSSPNRYSSGPGVSSMATGPIRSRAAMSSIATRKRSISCSNAVLMPMKARSAPTACAAMPRPSTTWYGFARSSERSDGSVRQQDRPRRSVVLVGRHADETLWREQRHATAVHVSEPQVPSAPPLLLGRSLDLDTGLDQTPVRGVDVVDLDVDLDVGAHRRSSFLHADVETAVAADADVPLLLNEEFESHDVHQQPNLGLDGRHDHEHA